MHGSVGNYHLMGRGKPPSVPPSAGAGPPAGQQPGLSVVHGQSQCMARVHRLVQKQPHHGLKPDAGKANAALQQAAARPIV